LLWLRIGSAEGADADGAVAEDVGFRHELAGEEGEIAGRGEVAVGDLAVIRGEAVRGAKDGVFHAEPLSAGVHAGDEGLATAGDLCEGVGGVVGGLDHEGEQQFFDAEGFARGEIDLGAAHGLVGGGGGDGGVEADLAGGEGVVHDEEGHELGDAGGRRHGVGVFLVQNGA
jgi:hypothetical protein